jgi:hypothetical protein
MNRYRYIIVVFFITLFLADGICSTFPQFFFDNTTVFEKLYSLESETEKKETGERTDSSIKKLYIDNTFPEDFSAAYLFYTTYNTAPVDVMYKKDIHISIATPPPEII